MMVDAEVCKKLNKLLSRLLKKGFGRDLNASLVARGNDLWVFGVDATTDKFVDVCGTIGAESLATIQARGFHDTDAGYRANAHTVLPLGDRKVDIFLLNTVHFHARPDRLEPLVTHELAHMLEQIGEVPIPQGNDEANADAIMSSLRANVANIHTRKWALHLAAGARMLIEKNCTTHRNIRSFLEAAISPYDRNGDIRAKEGP